MLNALFIEVLPNLLFFVALFETNLHVVVFELAVLLSI
jgi:hypothetical protein